MRGNNDQRPPLEAVLACQAGGWKMTRNAPLQSSDSFHRHARASSRRAFVRSQTSYERSLPRVPVSGVVLLVVALFGTACSGGSSGGSASRTTVAGQTAASLAAPAEQTLTLHIFRQQPNFDPGQQGGPGALVSEYTQALLRESPGGDAVPAAASSFDVSSDQLTYTFHLRPDGMFNDGTPVMASDFAFAWRRLIDPRVAAPQGSVFARAVKGCQAAAALASGTPDAAVDAALDAVGLAAPNASTFVVALARPLPYFKHIATLPTGAPIRKTVVDQFGATTWASDITHPERIVTNGPFKVSEVTPPNQGPTAGPITVVPNTFYSPKPTLTKIVNSRGFGPGKSDALWAEYLTNKRDLVQGPTPGPTREDALTNPQFKDQLYKPFLGEQVYLAFNTTKAPFNNVNVRRAFAQAIDRQAEGGPGGPAAGETRAVTTLIPQGSPGYNTDLGKPLQFNCDTAKASLAASGFTASTLPKVTLTLISSFETDVTFVHDQVKNCLGVNMDISAPVDDVKGQSADYQLYLSINSKPSFPDPQELFDTLLPSNPAALSKWGGPAADSYAAKVQQANAASGADRLRIFQDAEMEIINDVPVTFLWEYARPNWIKPWVTGLVKGIPFDNNQLPGATYSEQIKIAQH